jgi:hypothetical protein
MNLRRVNRDQSAEDNVDRLIRWALHDSVAGAEPSPQVWDRIQRGITGQAKAQAVSAPPWYAALFRRLSARWLVGAGAPSPVHADPRLAWQRRMQAFDADASLSVLRIIEGQMPAMRLVS